MALHGSNSTFLTNRIQTLHAIHGSHVLHQQYHLISNSSFSPSSLSAIHSRLSPRALKDIGAPPQAMSKMAGKVPEDSSFPSSSVSTSSSASPSSSSSSTGGGGDSFRFRRSVWKNLLPNSTVFGGSNNNASLTDVAADLAEAFIAAALEFSSDVEMPFLIIGGTLFFLFLAFLSLCCFRARALGMMAAAGKTDEENERETADAGMALLDGDPRASSRRPPNNPKRRRDHKSKHEKAFKIRALVLLFVFFALYVGMEVTYGGFLLTYAVRGPPKMNKDRGAFLTSVLWGSFSVGRLLAIPLSRALSPAVLLLGDVFITCVSAMGLIISGRKIPSILWVCSATLGLGMSSIFASGVNWAEQYISLTGKSTAVFVVAAATGEMAVPIVVGQLFDTKGPLSLMYVVLGVALASGVVFLLLLRLVIGRKPIRRLGAHPEGNGVSGATTAGKVEDDEETSGFLTDMETLDGPLDLEDDDDDGDLGGRQRKRDPKPISFFEKLRSNKSSDRNQPRPGGGKGKRVTFKLNDKSSHEYRPLTG